MCDERERLIGYVYDECEPSERKAIEAHLEDCLTCRAEISGLRDVRQDLLSWAVPPNEAVWRPLVAAPVAPWWRQVPAWAMAAAAGVMFLTGAAGSVVTHALVPHASASAVATASPAAEQAIPAGITASQLSEVEQRMVQMMRDELGKRPVAANGPVAPRAVPASMSADFASLRMNEIIGASEQRQWEIVRDVQKEWNKRIDLLKRELNGLKQEVVLMQSGGGR
ncbi:MAG TPA: zf-HC2 domain-containing protein [Vicinamibacterales bacterium]|nr:zf-HC2 domain-containing protein [Vicinamibacterales bacterium]